MHIKIILEQSQNKVRTKLEYSCLRIEFMFVVRMTLNSFSNDFKIKADYCLFLHKEENIRNNL